MCFQPVVRGGAVVPIVTKDDKFCEVVTACRRIGKNRIGGLIFEQSYQRVIIRCFCQGAGKFSNAFVRVIFIDRRDRLRQSLRVAGSCPVVTVRAGQTIVQKFSHAAAPCGMDGDDVMGRFCRLLLQEAAEIGIGIAVPPVHLAIFQVIGKLLFVTVVTAKLILSMRPEVAERMIAVRVEKGTESSNIVDAEVDAAECRFDSLTLQDGKQLRVVLPLPCLLQLLQEDGGFERGKGGLGAAVLIVMRGGLTERVRLFRGSGRGIAVVVRGGFSERVGLAGIMRADAVITTVRDASRRLARHPARGAAGFVAAVFVVVAQAQGFFVSGADAAEACRITVRTVLADECRVGGLDGGFVAGRRDAEGLPAIHSGSG